MCRKMSDLSGCVLFSILSHPTVFFFNLDRCLPLSASAPFWHMSSKDRWFKQGNICKVGLITEKINQDSIAFLFHSPHPRFSKHALAVLKTRHLGSTILGLIQRQLQTTTFKGQALMLSQRRRERERRP